MAVNKVIYNGKALVDFTADTVTADVLQSGYTAHQADGELITGTAAPASNLNLLDNWYFADPINQREQTEYTIAGYTIDRWDSNASVSINNGYITLNNTGNNVSFWQVSENNLFGKELTFSVLLLSGNLVSGTGLLASGINWATTTIYEDTQCKLVFQNRNYSFNTLINLTGNSIQIVAAKLELGPVQTLAHKEGGTWVLNDPPPNKAAELEKCQRYQVEINPYHMPYAYAGIAAVSPFNSKKVIGIIPVSVTMRAKPTISISGNWTAYFRDTKSYVQITSISVEAVASGLISAQFSLAADAPYIGFCFIFSNNDTGSSMLIDSNL